MILAATARREVGSLNKDRRSVVEFPSLSPSRKKRCDPPLQVIVVVDDDDHDNDDDDDVFAFDSHAKGQ